MTLSSGKQNKKIVFDSDDEVKNNHTTKKQKAKSNKRIVFSDKGDILKNEELADNGVNQDNGLDDDDNENDFFAKRDKARLLKSQQNVEDEVDQLKWYQVYKQYPCNEEILEMKESEQMELFNLCKKAFEAEKSNFNKRNPQDARWLQTALHKGTAKDSANAGALLVTTNPLGNLEALSTLIGMCKVSNKSSTDVVSVLTDLWKEVLLPPHRKLFSIQLRCADWKHLRKDAALTNSMKQRIYAYWYFENELKDQYFEFLKNLQQGLQTGQENNKNISIVAGSQLLNYAPEKEQMLLTMLVNKMGDPVAKIASKALHHLTEVALHHPNMSSVIVTEAEKLLFRNNISERAQHFALCFLANITPTGRPDVCTKLVNICFALFKVLVQKGSVNNRTMQAILRCLKKAIVEAQPESGSSEVLSKEMQDTIYRLVHQTDIRIAVQTLGLLLQLVTMKTQKADRFYNALYVKLLDLNLVDIGMSTAADLLHIVHRAIHMDANIPRAYAFVKRLLQLSLYTPANVAAGCLIVLSKLLRYRQELANDIRIDGFTVQEEVETAVANNSIEHKKESIQKEKDSNDMQTYKKAKLSAYDPYHRVPAFAGAKHTLRYELLLLRSHFHPTVQVFAENILKNERIQYYGDPLKDFGLAHFLERFAFKNPKKPVKVKAEMPSVLHKRYTSYGSRSKPVKSLTRNTCTEDEMYIFSFLERNREHNSVLGQNKECTSKGDVDDDEFDAYLEGFFGKKSSSAQLEEDLGDVDFLDELNGELTDSKSQKKNKKSKMVAAEDDEESNEDDDDDDWGDDEANKIESDIVEMSDDEGISANDDDDDEEMSDDNEEMFDDETGSIDFEDNSDFSDDEKSKTKKASKRKTELNGRSFAKKLKFTSDMDSLFAAADDFGELLEKSGKAKGQGTTNAVFNKDKSSDKQLKWEEKRRSNSKSYVGKNKMTGKPAKHARKPNKSKH